MTTEGRDDLGKFPGQGKDIWPILFARAVDHHFGNGFGLDGRHHRSQVRLQALILQMVVRVVEHGKKSELRSQKGIVVRLLAGFIVRSEEHTSELQSLRHLVCRLLLEKTKK